VGGEEEEMRGGRKGSEIVEKEWGGEDGGGVRERNGGRGEWEGESTGGEG